jgi:hypothetical protein
MSVIIYESEISSSLVFSGMASPPSSSINFSMEFKPYLLMLLYYKTLNYKFYFYTDLYFSMTRLFYKGVYEFRPVWSSKVLISMS